ALAKNPAERYVGAAVFLADLESGKASAALRYRRWSRQAPWKGFLAAALAIIVFLVIAIFWRSWRFAARPPLRVAVLRPIVKSGGNPELAFVASEVVEASLAALAALEGLQSIDPPERDEKSGSEVEKLRAADAD